MEDLYSLQIYFDVIEEIDCIIDKHVCALIKSDFDLDVCNTCNIIVFSEQSYTLYMLTYQKIIFLPGLNSFYRNPRSG